MRRFLLPVLTVFAVFCSVLAPPQVSLFLDSRSFGFVHTEELVGDGNFVLPSTTMAQRLRLLAAVEDQYSLTDHTYTTQAITQAEHEEACEMARKELRAFQDGGWLSSLFPLDELELYCYRFYVRQAENDLGASFLHVDINCNPLGFQAEMILDEETGRALRLELVRADYDQFRKHPISRDFSLFSSWFLDRLGLEGVELTSESSMYKVFLLTEAQVEYHLIRQEFMVSVIALPHDNEG